jgi:ribosomal protein L40E
MYQHKLIAALKSNNKTLRELNINTVKLKINSKYEIFIKNTNKENSFIINNKFIINKNSEGLLKDDSFIFTNPARELLKITYKEIRVHQVHISLPAVFNRESIFHPFGCDCVICNPPKIDKYVFPFEQIDSGLYSASEINSEIINAPAGATISPIISVEELPDGYSGEMIFNLLAEEKTLTVNTKWICAKCGTKNKYSLRFCPKCGSSRS